MHVSVARFFGYKAAPLGASTPGPAAAQDDTGAILDMLSGDPDG